MTQDQTLLDTEEAAHMLRLPPSTLRHWRQTDAGPAHVKLGRRVFYRRDALLTFLSASEVAR